MTRDMAAMVEAIEGQSEASVKQIDQMIDNWRSMVKVHPSVKKPLFMPGTSKGSRLTSRQQVRLPGRPPMAPARKREVMVPKK